LVDDDVRYLKGDEVLKPDFEKEELVQFTYPSIGAHPNGVWMMTVRCDFGVPKLMGPPYVRKNRSKNPKINANRNSC